MPKILIDIKSGKKTCGKCEYIRYHDDWSRFPDLCRCNIFDTRLKTKMDKLNSLSIYRLKRCLQAEKL